MRQHPWPEERHVNANNRSLWVRRGVVLFTSVGVVFANRRRES
jgi:hypothetical protein